MPLTPEGKSTLIKDLGLGMGFSFVGISKAGFLEEEAKRYDDYLAAGNQAGMSYLERNIEKRLDPTKLVPGSKSVISLMYNYFPSRGQDDSDAPKIAKYAYGEDYHFVIKRKLKQLVKDLQAQLGDFSARVFVDSAPVLERAWAAKSGLGWVGKNSMLINKSAGSFFFLAEIICDLELRADSAKTDHCGTCTACIDACPTDAILPTRTLDSNKCISYLTIELREDNIPLEYSGKMENWAFGCDICQDVCPWNRFSLSNEEEAFKPNPKMLAMTSEDWFDLKREAFREITKGSALKRAGYDGLKRNLDFLKLHGNVKGSNQDKQAN